MISFEEACARLVALPDRMPTERVSLDAALGRVLSSDVVTAIDSPREDVSTMDGYAVRGADLAGLPASLVVAGELFAGQPRPAAAIEPETCARIFTGAPLPPGADRVVIQEEVRREGATAFFEKSPVAGPNIRRKGSDFVVGDLIVTAGSRLDARSIVAAAAADTSEVEVYRKPRVTVLGTGDELADPGSARLSPGAIPDSVSLGVAAMVTQWGGACVGRLRLPDVPSMLFQAASEALASADLVVVTGGASVGEKDFSRAMFEPAGLDLIFSKVAIKPGKPVWLGRSGGRLVLGVPGNPTSALVCARLFLAPLLLQLMGGGARLAWRWHKAPLAEALPAGGTRETFVRACWRQGAVKPLNDQDSGAQRALATADLLVRRRTDTPPLDSGELVDVLDF